MFLSNFLSTVNAWLIYQNIFHACNSYIRGVHAWKKMVVHYSIVYGNSTSNDLYNTNLIKSNFKITTNKNEKKILIK